MKKRSRCSKCGRLNSRGDCRYRSACLARQRERTRRALRDPMLATRLARLLGVPPFDVRVLRWAGGAPVFAVPTTAVEDAREFGLRIDGRATARSTRAVIAKGAV